LLHPGEVLLAFAVYVLYEAATFTACGLIIGLVYVRTYGKQSPPVLGAGLPMPKRTWLYYLAFLGVVVLLVVGGMYQNSLQPVSFTARGIHFETGDGTVQVIANITNTSTPSLIQMNAAIDGLNDGSCGYSIGEGQTMVCNLQLIPLLSCAQIPRVENHTLTLWAYFSNTRTLTKSYPITSVQLGCS
jgi:hypothetical protein